MLRTSFSAFDPKRTCVCAANAPASDVPGHHLRLEALWVEAPGAIQEAGSKPRSAEINARGPK